MGRLFKTTEERTKFIEDKMKEHKEDIFSTMSKYAKQREKYMQNKIYDFLKQEIINSDIDDEDIFPYIEHTIKMTKEDCLSDKENSSLILPTQHYYSNLENKDEIICNIIKRQGLLIETDDISNNFPESLMNKYIIFLTPYKVNNINIDCIYIQNNEIFLRYQKNEKDTINIFSSNNYSNKIDNVLNKEEKEDFYKWIFKQTSHYDNFI